MSSTVGEPPEDPADPTDARVKGRPGSDSAQVIAQRFVDEEAAAVVLDVRRWFQTWALDLYQQLMAELGDDEIVSDGSLDLFVTSPSSYTVAQAIQSTDHQWRLALGLAAGRWEAPPSHRAGSWTPRDLRAAIDEAMVSPGEFGLVLISAEAGSLKSTWQRSGARKFLLSQELAALLSILSFAGVSGPAIARHLAVHRSDGTKCELNIRGTDLPAAQRDRLLHETAHLPDDCSIKIDLRTTSDQKASLSLPGPFRPRHKTQRFDL